MRVNRKGITTAVVRVGRSFIRYSGVRACLGGLGSIVLKPSAHIFCAGDTGEEV